MALSVTVLGCSGTYAAPEVPCTGYLVDSPDARVWLDAGPGTLANLQKHGSPDEIAAVVLTHEHPDHWVEMPVFVNVLKYFYEPAKPVPVYLTAGTAELLLAFHPRLNEQGSVMDLHVIDETSEIAVGDQQWRFSRTDHPVETLAVHVTSRDHTFAFSADTGPGWHLDRFGRPVDVALLEASVPDRGAWPHIAHLTAGEAARMARDVGVGQLVLTHLPPGSDHARHQADAEAVFGGPVGMARVGATFSVGHPPTRGTNP